MSYLPKAELPQAQTNTARAPLECTSRFTGGVSGETRPTVFSGWLWVQVSAWRIISLSLSSSARVDSRWLHGMAWQGKPPFGSHFHARSSPCSSSPLDVAQSSLAGFALFFFVWGQRLANWDHPLPVNRRNVINPLFGTEQLVARIA